MVRNFLLCLLLMQLSIQEISHRGRGFDRAQTDSQDPGNSSTLKFRVSQLEQAPTGVIAYVHSRADGKDIFVMDPDGKNKRAFVADGTNHLFPGWSPDGTLLALIGDRTGKWEINLRSYPGGSELRFANFDSFVSSPALSPDGKHVLFAKRTAALDLDLFISDLDGSNYLNVTNHRSTDASPTWAPSGNEFAFASNRDGGGSRIYVADLEGKSVRLIGKGGGESDSPEWSPDGHSIAFQWKSPLAQGYDIYFADVKTGKISQLTHGSGSNENPSWSPCGRYLALQSTRTGIAQIFVMRVDGTGSSQLTHEGTNTRPSWGGPKKSL